MMAGIHLDVQLYDKVCMLLRKKILRRFVPVEEVDTVVGTLVINPQS